MLRSIIEIISITDEDRLLSEFREFERALEELLQKLDEELNKQPLSQDIPKLELHMTFVESHRHRVSKYLMLVDAFVEHAKSANFLAIKGKGVTEFDRTAYQKKLTAGMLATQRYLLNTIDDIDSRVNECKKLLGIEGDVGGRRLNR